MSACGSAPRRRETPGEEGSTRIIIAGLTQKTQGPLNPDSPYAVHGRRFKALFDTQLNHRTPASADDVAQTIEHAITTDDPTLRYLVGQDAVEFVAARRRGSDENYIKFSAIKDDEDYFDAMKDWAGKEYFRP